MDHVSSLSRAVSRACRPAVSGSVPASTDGWHTFSAALIVPRTSMGVVFQGNQILTCEEPLDCVPVVAKRCDAAHAICSQPECEERQHYGYLRCAAPEIKARTAFVTAGEQFRAPCRNLPGHRMRRPDPGTPLAKVRPQHRCCCHPPDPRAAGTLPAGGAAWSVWQGSSGRDVRYVTLT